ncbi:hypothetical protein J1N35_022541, partial [Gossypium stocksii]
KKKVCTSKWIHQNIKRCINSQTVGVFVPHLATTLCKKARVPMTSTKQSLKHSRNIIKDTLFQQHIELRAKQIKDWNK